MNPQKRKLSEQIEDWLYGAEKLVCAMSLLIMLVAVSVSVCVRFFNLPLPNVAEWALVSMAPLTFVGVAMCSRRRMHIAVDFIDHAKSKTIRTLGRCVVSLLMLIFAVIFSWFSWVLLEDVILTGERMLDMGTPLYVPIFFFFAGMALMVIHHVIQLAHSVCELPKEFTRKG